MAKKNTVSKNNKQVNFTKEEHEKLAKFASMLEKEDLEKGISPSPISVGDLKEIQYKKLERDVIEHYLLLHPVIPRGIELKANRMIRRGYTISSKNEEARKYCAKILEDSGGLTMIKNWIKDAFAFGGAYLVLTRNKAKDAVLFLSPTHPIYFGISKYPKDYRPIELADKYKIDPKTKKPAFYSQYINKHGTWQQFGEPIPSDRIAHLKFDTWGDEAEGISIVQYLYLVVKYLLNIEDAAAQNMYRHGQTQKKLTTNITSEKKLKEVAKNVTEMNSKNVIILPEGTDVSNLLPGQTQFPEYHDKFLTLLAIRLGIPKPLLTMDGTSTNKACYSEDTEILTEDGWKYWWELNNKTKLMQYKDGVLELTKHKGIHTYDVDEDLYHFKNKSNDILVTKNHRMLFKESRQREYSIEHANNIKNRRIKFKSTGNWIEPSPNPANVSFGDYKIDLDDYLEFLGYYLSEGGFSKEPLKKGGRKVYNITFCEKKKNKIFSLFERLNKKYGIYVGNYENKGYTHFNICNKQIWTHIKNEGIGLNCNEKFIPSWIKNLSKQNLKILLDALIYGDGSKQGSGFVYYTTSEQLADDVQEIAFKCGYTATKYLHYKAGGLIKNTNYKRNFDGWRVFITKRSELVFDMKKDIFEVNYKGIVWCPSVPSGIIVTRRNGKITIQGNTLDEQKKDVIADFFADELVVKQTIEDNIFKPACELKFGKGFEEIPSFNFNEIPEDKDSKTERLLKMSMFVTNIVNSIGGLSEQGMAESAKKLEKFLTDNIDYTEEANKEEKVIISEE